MGPLRGFCCGMPRTNGNTSDNNLSKVTNNSGDDVKPQNGVQHSGKDTTMKTGTGGVGSRVAKGGAQSPVLVELFTSQGCSSCPPADALISKIGRGQGDDATELPAPVLVLGFHVDYWDYLGWKDPLASPSWTLRQRAYGQVLQQDSIYTPEVIVQGRKHCIGSNPGTIKSLIEAAPRFPAPDIHATFTQSSPAELNVSLTVSPKSKVEGYKLDVMVAIYENGLVTDCSKGENKGRMLTNDFVVTGLEKACTIQDLPAKKSINGQVTFKLWESFTSSKCGVVVFLQNPVSLEVFGAQKLDLPQNIK